MKNILITGGAGFIGSNTADYFLSRGASVTILDNFSRLGSRTNLNWLKSKHKKNLRVVTHDVRQVTRKLITEVGNADLIVHLAGQVGVVSSVRDPREDFDINALGTLNMLEAARVSKRKPIFIYSSTNKVYGDLALIPTIEKADSFAFKDLPMGISETQPLDLHSPYGCSKGAADQYVRDYQRIYGLRTIVFRQSCIYGPRQFGREDQGWLAWFMISAMKNRKITIYGSGKQVRDILYIDDLVRAYDLAAQHIEVTQGQIYNIGGGSENCLSIWRQFAPILEELFGKKIRFSQSDERPGDQNIFIADNTKCQKHFGWKPAVGIREGIKQLHAWITENEQLFTET